MGSSAPVLQHDIITTLSPSRLGLVGQTSASWGVAGGLIAALLVCGHVAIGGISASVAFLTATIFFLAGSLAGFLHGGLLGYLGRPQDVSRREALTRIGLGAMYFLPALAVGWLVAMLLVLSASALRSGHYFAVAASLLGWAAAGLFIGWAVVETRTVLHHLLRRWPDGRALLATLLLAFIALVPVFLITRPEIWIIGVRPDPATATFMALVASVWIVGPMAALAFLVVRAWRDRHLG